MPFGRRTGHLNADAGLGTIFLATVTKQRVRIPFAAPPSRRAGAVLTTPPRGFAQLPAWNRVRIPLGPPHLLRRPSWIAPLRGTEGSPDAIGLHRRAGEARDGVPLSVRDAEDFHSRSSAVLPNRLVLGQFQELGEAVPAGMSQFLVGLPPLTPPAIRFISRSLALVGPFFPALALRRTTFLPRWGMVHPPLSAVGRYSGRAISARQGPFE